MDIARLISAFRPNGKQLAASLLTCFILDIFVFQSLIVSKVKQFSIFAPFIGSSTQFGLSQINKLPAAGLVVEALFWGLVGVVGYLAYLGITNTLVEMRNEIVVETQYTNKGRIWYQFRAAAKLVAASILLIFGLWLSSSFGLPYWFSLMSDVIVNGYSWVRILLAMVSVIGLSLNVFIIWGLVKVVILVRS
ncbi:MAG: hypothetical protein ACHQUB_02975 [Candidatus Saccharimonadia bacterium]